MFDFLKKKINGFVNKLTGKEEEKGEPEKKEKPVEVKEEPKIIEEKKVEPVKEIPKPVEKVEAPKEEKAVEAPKPVEKEEVEKPQEVKKIEVKKPEPVKPKVVEKKKEPKKIEKKEVVKPAEKKAPEQKAIKKIEPKKEIPKPVPEKVKPKVVEKPKEVPKPPEPVKAEVVEKKPIAKTREERKTAVPEPKKEVKKEAQLGIFKQIKSFITQDVEIEEKDVHELLDNLELELLESDVDMSVAESIRKELEEKLIGAKVKKKELNEFIKNAVKESMIGAMYNENAFDIVENVKKGDKPIKIMFLGPNGAGKTTTIAKVANALMNNGNKVVLAAADTFRAAAIEQMSVHADRLKVKIIKREYGSDPTSVAYDAVNYAKAHGIDAVLIDTAGRQDTNINLINELKKMNRVIKPDMKVYIGESIAGNAIVEQLSVFHREIEVHGVILTKLDCDPKGGVVLSINKTTGVPIIYIGTGQKYEDLEKFEPQKIVERILE